MSLEGRHQEEEAVCPSPADAIRVEGFSFSYENDADSGKRLLKSVSFTVPSGAFALLQAKTGAGKTTLLRNIKPELIPAGRRSGQIRLFGVAQEELGAFESASSIGYVFQNPDTQIVCDSVWHELAFGLENIGIPQETMRRRVAETVHFFGMESWLDARSDSLSSGQKQLLVLAGALALRPRLLLLDEPTSCLDPIAAKSFLHALFRVNRELGITVVLATHEASEAAEYATELLELSAGQVVQRDIAAYRRHLQELSRAAETRRLLLFEKNAKRKSEEATEKEHERADGWDGALASQGEKRVNEAVLSVKDAHVRYGKGLPLVLRGATLQVARRSIHALIGGNGAGKTTLLAVSAGSVRGLRVERGSVKNRLRANQMWVPPDPKALFTAESVREELRAHQRACGYSDEEMVGLAERLRLDGMLQMHPYDLSGGQQQLLAFAKALLTHPALFLLDEPTKGLDAPCRVLLAEELLRAKRNGASVVLATHDLSFAAAVADAVSLVFDGQIACTQEPQDFFAENLFYRPPLDEFALVWGERERASL